MVDSKSRDIPPSDISVSFCCSGQLSTGSMSFLMSHKYTTPSVDVENTSVPTFNRRDVMSTECTLSGWHCILTKAGLSNSYFYIYIRMVHVTIKLPTDTLTHGCGNGCSKIQARAYDKKMYGSDRNGYRSYHGYVGQVCWRMWYASQ